MSFGALSWGVAAALSLQLGVQEASEVWTLVSLDGGATSLARLDYPIFPFEFRCEGTPPTFQLRFERPEDARARSLASERVLIGTVHIPPRPIRVAEWTAGVLWFETRLDRPEIEALVEGAAVVGVEVRSPDGQLIRYRSHESNIMAAEANKFLEYCAHHVKEANRQFEVDGIQVELHIDVDEEGIEDIRALAAKFEIRDVQKIFVGFRGPASSLVALVESRQVRDGDRTAYRQLQLRQKYWEYWESTDAESEHDILASGLWQARPRDLYILDRWTIRDGDWSIEVVLGEGVPYDDAVRIIHAFRAGALVDVREGPSETHLPAPTKPYGFQGTSAEFPPRIDRDEAAGAGESGRYEISMRGRGLQLRIAVDQVEVLGVWIRDH